MTYLGNYLGFELYEKKENGETVVSAYLDTPDGIVPCGIKANSVEDLHSKIDKRDHK